MQLHPSPPMEHFRDEQSYKGYGHVKEKNVRAGKAKLDKLLADLENQAELRAAS